MSDPKVPLADAVAFVRGLEATAKDPTVPKLRIDSVTESGNKALEHAGRGRVLFAVFHGEAMALTWCAGEWMTNMLEGCGVTPSQRYEDGSASGEGFAFLSFDLEVEDGGPGPLADGLYVGSLRIVDGGAESWEMPHIRDYYPGVDKVRPATKDEWLAHLRGEWPWEECERAR